MGTRLACSLLLALSLPQAPLRAATVAATASARQGDYASDLAHLAASVVPEAEDLAKWANRKKLYATRDDVYALILVLEPDHPVARKGLRFLKQRGGGWKQSDQYRRPTDKSEKAAAEYGAKATQAFAPLVEFGLDWLGRGESALPHETAAELAGALQQIALDDATRARLATVWDSDTGSWALAPVERVESAVLNGLEGTPAPDLATFAAYGLEVRLSELGLPLIVDEDQEAFDGAWACQLGASKLRVYFAYEDAPVPDSEDLAEGWESSWRVGGELAWPRCYLAGYQRIADPTGRSGAGPYLTLLQGQITHENTDGGTGQAIVLSGLTAQGGWSLLFAARPPLTESQTESITSVLGDVVRYRGDPRDPNWTEEEVRARWVEMAPEGLEDEMNDTVRTEHFIVFSNSGGGKKFGEKMEECYETIQELFPFDEVEGRRLLPVFLFRTPDQFHQFLVKNAGLSIEQARRTGGVAWGDLYTTWYEAPADPVHIHEATHQLFGNRLRLGSGGSWLQEGLAEYVETRENERSGAARTVKKARHMPLREFFGVRSLLMSTDDGVKGGSAAGDHYKVAALLVEFLRESDFAKDGFSAFLHEVGRIPRNDVERIEAAVRAHYDCTIEELDAAFVEYAKKR